MINEFQHFRNDFKNNIITFPNKCVNNLIKKYDFVTFPEKLNADQYDLLKVKILISNIMMIDYFQRNNDKIFIIGFDKTIILIPKSLLNLISGLFVNDEKISICFLNESKKNFDQMISIRYNIIDHDPIFQCEIDSFDRHLNLSNEKYKIWNFFKSCISGYLIKRGYQKTNIYRVNQLRNKETNDDSSKKIFNESDFIELRNAGASTISTILLVFYIEKEELLIIKKRNQCDFEYKKLYEREYDNYIKIKNPFLPKFYGITNKNNCLVTEFINGSLLRDIRKLNLTINEKITIIFELMIIIEFLHRNNFVYRDLKPNNLIIDLNKTIVLIDFDRMVPYDENSNEEIHTSIFNSFYAAPEVLKGKYSYASDIYSLGQLIYYILKDSKPNDNSLDIYGDIMQFYDKCIKNDEKERPLISQLIIEFYIRYCSRIQICNFFELYEQYLSNYYDNDTINTMKKLYHNENDPETQYQIGILYKNGKVVPYDIQKALLYLNTAVDKNHPIAQFTIGLLYYEGKVVKKCFDQAKKFFELSANQNNAEALDYLGNIYYKGENVEKNYEKAFQYFELSAKQDNPDALCKIGYFYENGYSCRKDFHKAKDFYEKSAKHNYPLALNYLGMIFIQGTGIAIDHKKGVQYLEQAEKLNCPEACVNLGYFYNFKSKNLDYSKGRYYYEKAIQLGSITAFLYMGNLYFFGVGVQQDFLQAKEWYEKAAEHDDADAFNVIGHLYHTGKGVAVNYTKAKEYFEKAVKKDHPNACNSLGNIYLNGNGIAPDYYKAKDLFEKSANLGNSRGRYLLGKWYLEGFSGTKDYLKAIECFEQSDFPLAYLSLGDICFKGLGVKKDIEKAIYYYKIASDNRNTIASFLLGVIYYYGNGVEQNYDIAKEYFIKSSNENDFNAFYYLAQLYENGKGMKMDLLKAIECYKKCISRQNEIFKIEYSQGCAYQKIENEKYYQSYNNLGMIYLFEYDDIETAEKYLSTAGYSEFPYGKNNFGVLKQFFLNDISKAMNMYENAAKYHFSISEFLFGRIFEEKGETSKAMDHYKNILKYEKEPLIYKNVEYGDDQLYSSNLFIYCLSNLKLLQNSISNHDTQNSTKYIVNIIFNSLFHLLFNNNYNSYSFKFLIEKINENCIITNLKDFILNFPWNENSVLINNSKTEWRILEQNSQRKRIVINVELNNYNDFSTSEANFFDIDNFHEQVKGIFNCLNSNRNKKFDSISIVSEKLLINENTDSDEKHLNDTFNTIEYKMNKKQIKMNNVNSITQIYANKIQKKTMTNDKFKYNPSFLITNKLVSSKKDIERLLEYTQQFAQIIKNIQCNPNDVNEIIENMMNILYTPPYPILFGRIGKTRKTNDLKIKKSLTEDFYMACEVTSFIENE